MTQARFPCNVTSEGILVPEDRQRTGAFRGKRVFVSLHNKPLFMRGPKANSYLWAVLYRAIADATGNDPDTVHQACKREAVRVGVLEPQYILSGSKLLEVEPTTVTDQEAHSNYCSWLKAGCIHGDLFGMQIEIPETE